MSVDHYRIVDTCIEKRRVQPNGYVHHDKITLKTKCDGYDNDTSILIAKVEDEIITIDDPDFDNHVILVFAELEAVYNFYKELQNAEK